MGMKKAATKSYANSYEKKKKLSYEANDGLGETYRETFDRTWMEGLMMYSNHLKNALSPVLPISSESRARSEDKAVECLPELSGRAACIRPSAQCWSPHLFTASDVES